MNLKHLLPSLAVSGGIFIAAAPAFAQSWVILSNAPILGPIACSADGAKLVAAGCLIYTSPNGGATLAATTAPDTNWSAVAASTDGNYLVAAAYGGLNYTSTNSGAFWAATTAPATNWVSVACSADGAKIVAAVFAGLLYTSTNSGATWNATAPGGAWEDWQSVAASADGTHFAAAGVDTPIYISTNAGVTWAASGAPI